MGTIIEWKIFLLQHLITTKSLGDFGSVMGAIPRLPALPKPLLYPPLPELELELELDAALQCVLLPAALVISLVAA